MANAEKYDLHLHSTYSPDSLIKLSEVVKLYKKKSYTGFALTDHNTVAGHAEAKTLAKDFIGQGSDVRIESFVAPVPSEIWRFDSEVDAWVHSN